MQNILEHFYIHTDIDKDCQIKFAKGRGFAEVQILKKVKLVISLEPCGIIQGHFEYKLILTRSSLI